jgi:cation diffusion facilitator CzcD-associated flavoprotein CzcO
VTPDFDAVILGAGPYGLAAAAHLRQIEGLEVRIFGEPMEFWKCHMPEGMLLRSPWPASHISDPAAALTMDAFRGASSRQIPVPVPLDQFVDYGLWFQSQVVPEVDRRRVAEIRQSAEGFDLLLNDGSSCRSRRVVIAAGIGSFAVRPPQFEGLPPDSVSHASDHRNVRSLSGKRVVVLGAGQSALESAALMHEAGAEVEVIVRSPSVHWLGWKARIQKLGPVAKLLYSPYDIGPAGVSRIVALPNMVRYFPRNIQDGFRKRALRPAGARWLVDRCKAIPIKTNTHVTSASLKAGKVLLKLNDGTSREADKVLLGTGYHVDISRYPFLPPALSRLVDQVNGFPKLKAGFESSVPGLYFLGAPSAWTFGPLMYFVCGTDFAARNLARHFAVLPSPKIAVGVA